MIARDIAKPITIITINAINTSLDIFEGASIILVMILLIVTSICLVTVAVRILTLVTV